jgi:hypothetical protein
MPAYYFCNIFVSLFKPKSYNMTKLFFSAIAVALIFGLTSCSKTETDNTSSIVGTYVGTIVDTAQGNSTTYTNQTITVTKVDNSHVSITSAGSNYDGFSASVSDASGYIILSIPSQTSTQGSNIQGLPFTIAGTSVSVTGGAYTKSSRKLNTYTVSNDGGLSTLEAFEGTKQ